MSATVDHYKPGRRLLILGGTGEANRLAARCRETLPDWRVISSLAGRTRRPAAAAGEYRVGGFGGVDGLRDYLQRQSIDRVIDATHPFAATISAAAVAACDALALPRLALLRQRWRRQPGDRWYPFADLDAAATRLADCAPGRRVLVTSGRRGLAALRRPRLAAHRFVVRLIEPPAAASLPDNAELLLARGPFAGADELALLRRLQIDVLLSKNSGGAAGYGKIAAARELRLPVLMLTPPPPPPGARVFTIDEALRWLRRPA